MRKDPALPKKSEESNYEDKKQESMPPSTTPDPGHHFGK